MKWLKFLVLPSIKKIYLILKYYLTNKSLGVMTHLMQISNVKIFNKLTSLKVSFVKTGIFLSLAAYWGVIIVGTFITFN